MLLRHLLLFPVIIASAAFAADTAQTPLETVIVTATRQATDGASLGQAWSLGMASALSAIS